jgi:hypothetical protein
MTYDLTYFKFLGGIVIEEGPSEKELAHHEHHHSAEEHNDSGNRAIFHSTWNGQHHTERRASIKLVTKVADLKSKFEKGKRVVSGVFSAITGGDSSATESKDGHKAHRRPTGPPPPQHVMTLAKGWNSGLEPSHTTKHIEVEY